MRILKVLAYVLGGVVGVALLAVLAIWGVSVYKTSQRHGIAIEAVDIPTDTEAIAQGKYLFTTRTCVDCHGPNAAGTDFIRDPALGAVYAPNLTPAGVGATYTDKDWVAAIRHGIRPDGTSLIFMPVEEFYYLDDTDLGNLIAYLKSLPAAGTPSPAPALGPIGRALVAADQIPLAVTLVDHTRVRPAAVPHTVTAEYGRYLATFCTGCHSETLTGGPVPGEDPTLISPPLTSVGNVGHWTQEEFSTALRTGQRPDGSRISEVMPWASIGQSTDTDLTALYLYLHTLPAEGYEYP